MHHYAGINIEPKTTPEYMTFDNKGITWLFEGILFTCANVVSFATRAWSARAPNDTTREQINNIPEKSHVIIIINKQGQMISRMRALIIQAKWITKLIQSLQIIM